MGSGAVGGNPSLAAINNMQPLQVQKYLNQAAAPHNVSNAQTAVSAFSGNATGNHSSGQPSAQHLRMLVQQIQMAVQGGYLSSQILNQPLAPATLILLNQLLSTIKVGIFSLFNFEFGFEQYNLFVFFYSIYKGHKQA